MGSLDFGIEMSTRSDDFGHAVPDSGVTLSDHYLRRLGDRVQQPGKMPPGLSYYTLPRTCRGFEGTLASRVAQNYSGGRSTEMPLLALALAAP
jgi:hypothetical protein